MELEVSIESLLDKYSAEWERIDFKSSWSPDDIYNSNDKKIF